MPNNTQFEYRGRQVVISPSEITIDGESRDRYYSNHDTETLYVQVLIDSEEAGK